MKASLTMEKWGSPCLHISAKNTKELLSIELSKEEFTKNTTRNKRDHDLI